MMFGDEFYPTPPEIVAKMLAPYREEKGGLFSRTILEPSAGRGDIADAINAPERHQFSQGNKLDCIEASLELAAILREKRHRIVGHDFLSFVPSKMYDLIVMNPPFSNGDEHLLHAWDILDGGDIVCLLNETTVTNPSTKRRQVLARIIEEHGQVEFLGACFDAADRKTGVRVALVRLFKTSSDQFRSVFENAHFERREDEALERPGEIFLPAKRGQMVETTEMQFQEALDIYRKMLALGARLNTALRGARGHGIDGSYIPDSDRFITDNVFPKDYSSGFNAFVEQLTIDSWQHIVNMAGLRQLMTAKVRNEFTKEVENGKTMAFSSANIYALLDGLRHNVVKIQQDALNEVFDYLTKFHHENREYVEGWKTNDRFKVGKRFILPMVVRHDYFGFGMSYYRNDELNDIDRVMCSLEGRKIEDILTIDAAIQRSFKSEDEGRAESEFFHLRYFKKGTVHFLFKDESLRERFCITYAKGKNWLPNDYTYEKDGPIMAALEQAA